MAVTLALIAVNVAVYVVMIVRGVSPLAPSSDVLIRWGADYGPFDTHGQWWRLFSAMFIHFGLLHLVMNMAVLASFGQLTERLLGRVRFMALYLLSGVAGGVASIAVHPFGASAGASGAIFGVCGGLIGCVVTRHEEAIVESRTAVLKSGLSFVAINLLYGAFAPNVDLTAHVAGLIVGVALGAVLSAGLMSGALAPLKLAGLTLTGAALLTGAAMRLPVVDDWLGEQKQVFALDQTNGAKYRAALAKVNTSTLPAADFARLVNEQLLPPWQVERARLLALRLPRREKTRAGKLAEYMSFKADEWRLAADGLLKRDVTVIENSRLKQEAALTALEEFAPSKAVADSLTALRAERTRLAEQEARRKAADAVRLGQVEAFVAEVKRLEATEKDLVRTLNESMLKLRSKEMSAGQVADVIDVRVLPRWSRERAALAQTHAPDGQAEFLNNLLRYMALRDDSWSLMARALRTDSRVLVEQSQTKRDEANRLAKAMARAQSGRRTP